MKRTLEPGCLVEFHPKVFAAPYAPSYDAYEGHQFKVIALHCLGHVEVACVDDPGIAMAGHVHKDELIGPFCEDEGCPQYPTQHICHEP
jgi:hypothetical protein